MDALHPFERPAWQTGKYVSKSAICFDEVVLRVFQREGQLGGQRSQVFPGGFDERARHNSLRLADDFRLSFAIFANGGRFFGPLGRCCRCRIRLCFLFELALVGSAAFEVEIDNWGCLCSVIAGDGASYRHSFDTAAHSEEVSVWTPLGLLSEHDGVHKPTAAII